MGWALRAIILPNPKAMRLPEKMATGYALGFAYLGWLVNLSLLLFQRVPYWLWWGSCLVIPVAVALRRQEIMAAARSGWRRPSLSFNRPSITSLIGLCALCIIIFQIVFVLAISLSNTIGPDGLYVWAIKAKAIYLDSAEKPGELLNYLTSDTWGFTHNDYPLAFPSFESWIYVWIGKIDEQPVKLISAFSFTALLTLTVCHLRRYLPMSLALLPACLLATAQILINYSTTGYADVPLATIFGGAAVFSVDYICRRDKHSQDLCIILAGCAALVKNEGTLLLILLIFFMCLTLLLSDGIRPSWSFIKKSIVIIAIIIGPYLLSRITIPFYRQEVYSFPSIQILLQNRSRIGEVFPHLLRILTDFNTQGLIWIVTGIFLLASIAHWKRSVVIFLAGVCASYLIVICFSYVFSRWPDYISHVQSSMDRLVIHVAPVAALLTGHLWAAIRIPGKIDEDDKLHGESRVVL